MKLKYDCEYCGGWFHCGFDTPEACQSHEQKCDHNPAMKTCCTCKHHDWPKTKEQGDKWQRWDDSEQDYVTDMGCVVFGDQTFRKNCEKWEAKKLR